LESLLTKRNVPTLLVFVNTLDKVAVAYHPDAVQIDLNADVGEGFPDDAAVVAAVSSVNVACGGHAGDPTTIAATVELARSAGAAIGAHPSYPDRDGFGRREIEIDDDALEASLVEQLLTVADVAERAGAPLHHVKPHGALYNVAARDPAKALVVARAVRAISADLVVVGLARSPGLAAIAASGLRVAAEAFADRRYEPDGRLRDRRHGDALVEDPADAARRAVDLARTGRAAAVDGSVLLLRPTTVCVHGDAPGAGSRAAAVRAALAAAGIEVRPPPV
jgi:UPF0271 protein